MDKLQVARRQLGMATHIFVADLDPVSVHTLVCASREILERICAVTSTASIIEKLANNAGRPVDNLRKRANQYGRAFKHHNPKADDDELLAAFSDEQNDFLLFIAWHDYRALTGAMPFEAQVLYSWVEALYPDKMAIQRDFSHIPLLTGMAAIDRKTQKARLKMTVEMASGMQNILAHQETEKQALVLSP